MFQRPHQIVFAALIAVAFVGSDSTDAAILAKYVFNNGSTASAGDDGLADPQGFVNHGNGGDINFSGSSHNAFFRSQGTAADQAGALADSDYFSVTINAASGSLLNLDSIVFDFGASNHGDESSTVESFVYLQSDVDGTGSGNPVLFSDSKITAYTGGGAGSLTSTGLIDLTDARFQGLGSITFRFSFSDDQDTSSHIARLDNVILNGTVATVAVPTPAALPAGLTLMTLAVLRRRA